ncbi:MAG TPA: hypothetical protein VMN03_12965 [Burkholderiales bacterium]|nr:hypothetical protein [Burkholderiales bacterium]
MHRRRRPVQPAQRESAARANVVPANRDQFSVLAINGGSSSIRFAVYARGESLRRYWKGKWIASV